MNSEKIGSFIKSLREKNNLTQEALAEKIPISREAVSKWERGKNLPDIAAIKKLSDIFNVKIDDILAGEMHPKENIALQLYKDRNKNKKYFKFSLMIIILILVVFLTYYFVNQYRSIKIYNITGIGENFNIDSGLLIVTREKMYFNLGQITNKNSNLDIENLELYYQNPSKKQLVSSTNNNSIVFKDYSGYLEYCDFNNINQFINNLYLKISYSENVEVIKLNLKIDYINDNIIFKNKKNISNGDISKDLKNDDIKIKKVIIEKFTKNDDGYSYKLTKENYNFEFTYIESENLLNMGVYYDNKFIKEINYNILNNNFIYSEYDDETLKYSFIYDGNYKCKYGDCISTQNMIDCYNNFLSILNSI